MLSVLDYYHSLPTILSASDLASTIIQNFIQKYPFIDVIPLFKTFQWCYP